MARTRYVPIGGRQGEHNDNLKCYIDFKLQGVVVVAFKVVVLHVHVWERLRGLGKHLSVRRHSIWALPK